jgi:hypothetical protein
MHRPGCRLWIYMQHWIDVSEETRPSGERVLHLDGHWYSTET